MIIDVTIDGQRYIYVANDVDESTCGGPGYRYQRPHHCRCGTCKEWWRQYVATRKGIVRSDSSVCGKAEGLGD